VTITRKRHAFEGQALTVISAIRRRSIDYLLAVLPDGSRSLIPASWTDWNMESVRRTPPINTDDDAHDLGRLGDLLRLRNLVDALCNRHAESAPRKESRHAIELEFSRSTRPPPSPSPQVPTAWEQIDAAARIAAVEILARLITRMLQNEPAMEASDE
jgi:hypothetical protein